MAGALFSFSCPIDTIGDENGQCTWTVVCNDGEKINIKVPANEIKNYCLQKGSTILPTSVYGIYYDVQQNCETKCGDANPDPLEGYIYYEYENCNVATQKEIFRAPSSFTAWPNTLAYQSICWTNGVSTSNISYLDVADIPVYSDCATCATALAPTPTPTLHCLFRQASKPPPTPSEPRSPGRSCPARSRCLDP